MAFCAAWRLSDAKPVADAPSNLKRLQQAGDQGLDRRRVGASGGFGLLRGAALGLALLLVAIDFLERLLDVGKSRLGRRQLATSRAAAASTAAVASRATASAF